MTRLVGIGVGPGDPEMVTVKGVRLLREADTVLVPVLDRNEPGRAETTVEAYVDPTRLHRVLFALNEQGGLTDRRTSAWDRAAGAVIEAAHQGSETVAFATIGDPNLYSTFTYLARTVRDRMPDLAVETVPGITAMQDLAMRTGTVLAEGTEPVTLVPLTGGGDRLHQALESDGTVVAYKCGTRLPQVVAALRESGRLDGAVYGSALGLPSEDIRPAAELDPEQPAAYLSTVIAPYPRPGRGGRLR